MLLGGAGAGAASAPTFPPCSQPFIAYDSEFAGESEDEEEPAAVRRKLTEEEYQMMSPDSRLVQYQCAAPPMPPPSQRLRPRVSAPLDWPRSCRSVRAQMKTYYAASWHGTASAVLAYSLVTELNRATNQMLWYAIAGLTDQLVRDMAQHKAP